MFADTILTTIQNKLIIAGDEVRNAIKVMQLLISKRVAAAAINFDLYSYELFIRRRRYKGHLSLAYEMQYQTGFQQHFTIINPGQTLQSDE